MSLKNGNGVDKEDMSIPSLVDIGINVTHRTFKKHWRDVIQRAVSAGVETVLLTGTSLPCSKESVLIAQTWYKESGYRNLFATVGVHPHDAKHFHADSMEELRAVAKENASFVVAIGECGLDFNRNFSSREDQIKAFRQQVHLACEMKLPIFVHEREAHMELLRVLDEVEQEQSTMPSIVIHCFTGSKEEAMKYIERGYYIGFTGTICKKERGAPLRELLPSIPLNQIMLETDAPFMSFKKGRRHSEPADIIDVAKTLSDVIGMPYKTVCAATTENARRFFQTTNS